MLLKPLGVQTITIGIALVAGIIVGTIYIGPAMASTIANTYSNRSIEPAHVYPRNENGQTYGSELYATSPATAPDLILARGVDGTIGYVRSADLNEEMPKTPEEALAQQNMHKVGDVRQIPLYAVDGKTVIGKFNIVTTQGSSWSAEEINQKTKSK